MKKKMTFIVVLALMSSNASMSQTVCDCPASEVGSWSIGQILGSCEGGVIGLPVLNDDVLWGAVDPPCGEESNCTKCC